MYELKKNGKVFTSKSVGTGPSSCEKRIYRAAVSQRLINTALNSLWMRVLYIIVLLCHNSKNSESEGFILFRLFIIYFHPPTPLVSYCISKRKSYLLLSWSGLSLFCFLLSCCKFNPDAKIKKIWIICPSVLYHQTFSSQCNL